MIIIATFEKRSFRFILTFFAGCRSWTAGLFLYLVNLYNMSMKKL